MRTNFHLGLSKTMSEEPRVVLEIGLGRALRLATIFRELSMDQGFVSGISPSTWDAGHRLALGEMRDALEEACALILKAAQESLAEEKISRRA